jgi:hypothetical protein
LDGFDHPQYAKAGESIQPHVHTISHVIGIPMDRDVILAGQIFGA